jgi:hypothetical protein
VNEGSFHKVAVFAAVVSIGNVLLWLQSNYIVPYNRRLHIEELRIMNEHNRIAIERMKASERLAESNIALKETIELDRKLWEAQAQANKRNLEGRE